jgi:hypothetical protein
MIKGSSARLSPGPARPRLDIAARPAWPPEQAGPRELPSSYVLSRIKIK